MRNIKFSHTYSKFGFFPQREVKLLQALKVHHSELSNEFISYDTAYLEGEEILFYDLPKTELIILIFRMGMTLFTTIRRYTPEKFEYYKTLQGQSFDLVIKK